MRRGRMQMELRPYRPDDCAAVLALFRQSVRTAAAADYTERQRLAWAPDVLDAAAWNRSLLAHTALVAEADGRPIGFADADTAGGYLDRLYVHPDFLRRGVATALCAALEAAMETDTVRVDASITARPFFEGRGYRVVRRQQVLRRGVVLTNFAMEKRL